MVVPLRISLPFRARFDETTPQDSLRTSSHLRWMQDVAWYHSASAGFDMAWYARSGRFWLVRRLELDILGPIRHADPVEVSTEVVGFRRIWARRVSEFRLLGAGDPFVREGEAARNGGRDGVRDAARTPPGDRARSSGSMTDDPDGGKPAGDLVASAAIDWVMTDVDGKPVRVPDELLAAFDRPERSIRPIRLELPEPPPGARTATSRVLAREIDAMGHMNNAAYLDHLEEAVCDAGGENAILAVPRRYALEYVLPAGPGMRVVTTAWRHGLGWVMRMTDETGATLFHGSVEPESEMTEPVP